MSRPPPRRARKKTSPGDGERAVVHPWREVRPDQVARARKLLEDPSYPPKKVTDAVAALLARHLGPDR